LFILYVYPLINLKDKIMKKILALIAFTTIATISFSQVYIGGTLYFSGYNNKTKVDGTKTDGTSGYNYTFAPEAQFYLSDRFAICAAIGYSLDGYKNPNSDYKTSSNTYYLMPGARYDFMSKDKVKLFVRGLLDLGLGKEKYDYDNSPDEEYSQFEFGAGILPGIAYELNDKFEISAMIGAVSYTLKVSKDEDDNKNITNNYNFGIRSNLSFSLHYKF
jgi:hypothetical protein